MFENDAFHKRGQALEDEFFHRVDEQLRDQLRESIQREKSRELLAEATGFKNPELLDHLIDAGIESSAVAALALAPAVFVAWADGDVTAKERQVVMSEALGHGIDQNPISFQLIERWLEHCPPESLWKLWQEYATGVHESMSPAASKLLMTEIHQLATKVANASGGVLGRGKISKAEQNILDKIESIAG